MRKQALWGRGWEIDAGGDDRSSWGRGEAALQELGVAVAGGGGGGIPRLASDPKEVELGRDGGRVGGEGEGLARSERRPSAGPEGEFR